MRIEGMHCAACVATIEKALIQQSGVTSASVNLLEEKATIDFDPTLVSRERLEATVESTGYKPQRPTLRVSLNPTPRPDEWTHITQTLEKEEGILSVGAIAVTGQLVIEYDEDLVSYKTIRYSLKKIGFSIADEQIADMDREALSRQHEIQFYSRRFLFALLLTIPIVVFSFLPQLILPFLPLGITPNHINLVLTTPVQFFAGYPFYKSSINAARHGKTNMDTLIMLGTSTAYFYSVFATFALPGRMAFFESAAMLLSFILLGRTLEAIAKGRTSKAIRSLMDLQPQTAILLRNNEEVEVPTDEVEVGDLLLVKPGAQIPVDGTVVRGQSAVNEAMVTGESIPVSKTLKDKVIGGTINQTGTLTVQAKSIGQDTVLAQIIKLVEDAQTHKPPIQRRADAIAARFVPFIIILAVATFVVWLVLLDWISALGFAIAVLVAACPCALGLATPAALMVGISRGAQMGILFKSGEGLEAIPQVDTIVFDKTGTLTVGHPTVTDFITVEGITETEVLPLVGSLERLSEHPLADAIVEFAKGRNVQFHEVTDFQSIPGQGVTGRIGKHKIAIGSDTFMQELNIDLQELLPHLPHLQQQGKTTLFAAQNNQAFGLIAVADTLKPDSSTAINQLQQMGIDVTMLTGDREVTAQAIARTVGINHVVAQVLPGEKAKEIRRLQSEGHRVAMAGDGVNDAPALAQADVGIALGSGTDVSVEAGDIVLVNDNLLDVVSAVQLGRKTMLKIKQGFFWALIYNMILLPIAAGILFPYIILRPEWAALAMALSSVSVVTNALLLNRFKPPLRSSPTATLSKPRTQEPDFAIDPVCKMRVDTKTMLHTDHHGKRYFFCSNHCQVKFETNPLQYENQDVIEQ